MFNKLNKPLTALVILLGVYNFFFWNEKLGANIALFSILLAVTIILLNPDSLKSRKTLITICAVIYCCLMTLLNNSAFSKFTLITGLMVFAGYAHQPESKSLFASFFTYISTYFMIPVTILEGFIKTKQKNKVLRTFYTAIKLGVIPILVFFVFYTMYAAASPKFSFYSDDILQHIKDFLYNVFKDYPALRFAFLFLGFILLSGVLYNKNIGFFKRYDLLFREKILRDKTNKLVWLNTGKRYISSLRIFKPGMNSLLTEYKIGVILLILMNLLILGLNIVDIEFLWLNFDPSEITGLASYVHQGTYMLIFSIILSMVILLFYFRGNLNFYRKNRILKILSLSWICQNVFMALSVALRDYYYVIYIHAISYKRIGVLVYLLLTLVGLVTMILKITQKRSTYNILKINSWAVFIVFLLMSSFNWDMVIAEYNIANPNRSTVDISYILSLGDDVLPLVDKNRDLLNNKTEMQRWSPTEQFNNKKLRFMNEQESYSWLSWNLPDRMVYKYFKNSGNTNNYQGVNNEN